MGIFGYFDKGPIVQELLRLLRSGDVIKFNEMREAKKQLSYVNLDGIDLSGANLKGVNLSNIDLKRSNLSGANLTRADLSGAILQRVFLAGADLNAANLNSADLYEADVPYVHNLPISKDEARRRGARWVE